MATNATPRPVGTDLPSAIAQKGVRSTILIVGLSPGYVAPTQMAAEIKAMVKGAQILNHYAKYTYQWSRSG